MLPAESIMSESHNYTYQSLNVAYQKLGEGKPLVVLHGWGSSGKVMMPLAETLASIRTCYVLDLPGFGDSSLPGYGWAIEDYADLIQSFIEDQNLEKVDLLVHSLGGRITLKLCAREQGKKLVDKVIITGGAGMKPKRSPGFYFRKYLAKTLKAPFLVFPGNAREKALEKLRSTRLWKSLGSSDYQELSGVMRQTFVKLVTEYLEPCLPGIPHEVLLLWGSNDEITPLYQAKRMEQGLKNSALVVIDNAGHYAFLDRPRHFASIAKAFFEG